MHAIAIGLRRRRWGTALLVATAMALTWGVIEPVQAAVSWPAWTLVAIVGVGAVVITCVQVRAPRTVRIRWPMLDVDLTIRTGDLFAHDGPIVVPFDDLFLVEHPKLVNDGSLVSLAVAHRFGGVADALRDALAPLLVDVPGDPVPSTTGHGLGGAIQYPVGTTVTIPPGASATSATMVHAVALCRVDLATAHGSVSPQSFWTALTGLWGALAHHPTTRPVGLPLLGAGQSGVGLDRTDLLHLMVMSLLAAARQGNGPTDPIVIYLQPDVVSDVDLAALRTTWDRSRE